MIKRLLPHEAPMTEKERFADLVGIVTPLKTPPQAEDFGKQAKILQRRRIEAQRIRHATAPQEARHNLAAIPDARFHALCAGRLPVAREIDLHGFFVDEALRYLQDLIDERSNFRPEIWTVIHGKGKEEIAPLKIAVWQLLQRHPAVIAIAPVLDYRGESGAVQIEIKRGRRRR